MSHRLATVFHERILFAAATLLCVFLPPFVTTLILHYIICIHVTLCVGGGLKEDSNNVNVQLGGQPETRGWGSSHHDCVGHT